jgi:hypothetical protein
LVQVLLSQFIDSCPKEVMVRNHKLFHTEPLACLSSNLERLISIAFDALIDADGCDPTLGKSILQLDEEIEQSQAVLATRNGNSDVIVILKHVMSNDGPANFFFQCLSETLGAE